MILFYRNGKIKSRIYFTLILYIIYLKKEYKKKDGNKKNSQNNSVHTT
jgi:hypothetical protein